MLQIVTFGDALLRKKSVAIPEVTDEIRLLIESMFESMYAGKGIGLAAVQVGRLDRIFIAHVPEDVPRVFINPEITATSIEQNVFEEGCLSIPGAIADIKRPDAVRIQAWNERERPFVVNAGGLLARVIQHENDHLNGVLFVDLLDKRSRKRLVDSYSGEARV